jgi:hypothetical protein
MTWALKVYQYSESASIDFLIYGLDCGENPHDFRRQYFLLFNREQAEAVCAFLHFMADDADGMPDIDAAFGALKRYWGQFCR